MRLIWICCEMDIPPGIMAHPRHYHRPRQRRMKFSYIIKIYGTFVLLAHHVSCQFNMSESHSPRTDFSIDRILAKDEKSQINKPKDDCAIKSAIGDTCVNFKKLQSIGSESIGRDWFKVCSNFQGKNKDSDSVDQTNPSTQQIKQQAGSEKNINISEELSWLQCTRYRPPKLLRKTCSGKFIRRKPGSHPRIPFTKHQLEILEENYKSNPYLSRKDVVHLSDLLYLPQSRIKIWFQNRRARARRESDQKDK